MRKWRRGIPESGHSKNKSRVVENNMIGTRAGNFMLLEAKGKAKD